MAWKYRVMTFDVAQARMFELNWLPVEDLRKALDELGEQNWELVSVVPATTWHTGQVGAESMVRVMAVFKKSDE